MLPLIGYSLPARETDCLTDDNLDAVDFQLNDFSDAAIVSKVLVRHSLETANVHLGQLSLTGDLAAWQQQAEPVEHLVSAGWSRTVSVTLAANAPAVHEKNRLEHAACTVRALQRQFDGSRLFLETMPLVKEPATPVRDSEFQGELLRRTGCGWLLNVADLCVRSRNQGFDPYDFIAEVIPYATNVVIRVASVRYEKRIGAEVTSAEGAIPDEVWSLMRHALVLGCHKTRAIFIAGRNLRGAEKPRKSDLRHARFIVDRVQGRQRLLRQQPVSGQRARM